MVWMLAGMAVGLAMQGVSMAQQNSAAGASAASQARLTREQRKQDEAKNKITNVESSSKNWQNAYNNNKILKQAGKAYEAGQDNLARINASNVRNKLEASIQGSEGVGAMMAHSAMTGTGGASVDALASSMAMSQARGKFAMEENMAQQYNDTVRQVAEIMPMMAQQMELGVQVGDTQMNSTAMAATPPNAGAAASTIGEFAMQGGKMIQNYFDSQPVKTTMKNTFVGPPRSAMMPKYSSTRLTI